jgi:hypothetical protein
MRESVAAGRHVASQGKASAIASLEQRAREAAADERGLAELRESRGVFRGGSARGRCDGARG